MLIKDNRPKENHLRKGDKRFKMIRIDWKCGKLREEAAGAPFAKTPPAREMEHLAIGKHFGV